MEPYRRSRRLLLLALCAWAIAWVLPSGGESFRPVDPRGIAEALGQVARHIRHSYALGYAPTNSAHDGAFRRVHVVVTAPPGRRFVVRTRAGYVAGSRTP